MHLNYDLDDCGLTNILGAKGNLTSVLEVVDVKSCSLKEIDLSSKRKGPEAQEQFSPGQVVSLGMIGIPGRGDARVTAVLNSQGCIRLFETDESSLQSSQRSWKEIMGAGERQSVDGSLYGQKEAEGTSKPRFGVDTPKHGKEDPNNDPHVGGNTWAGWEAVCAGYFL